MARLTLTDDDARIRKWFADEVQKLGASLSVDQMGNMFARTPGKLRSPAPMIAVGSHLDTQPRGGRYDGILGIMAALEAMRTMKENGYQTNYDVGIVNSTKYVFLRSSDISLANCVFLARKGPDSPNPCVRLASGRALSRSRKPGTCAMVMILI